VEPVFGKVVSGELGVVMGGLRVDVGRAWLPG
jgi:hypothetical protein